MKYLDTFLFADNIQLRKSHIFSQGLHDSKAAPVGGGWGFKLFSKLYNVLNYLNNNIRTILEHHSFLAEIPRHPKLISSHGLA